MRVDHFQLIPHDLVLLHLMQPVPLRFDVRDHFLEGRIDIPVTALVVEFGVDSRLAFLRVGEAADGSSTELKLGVLVVELGNPSLTSIFRVEALQSEPDHLAFVDHRDVPHRKPDPVGQPAEVRLGA